MNLTTAQRERAVGVLIGQACGGALGVPYEFGAPPRDGRPEMKGGGLGSYAPGEWSDDTQMALCIAEVAATGADLTTEAALDEIASKFEQWYAGRPADIGVQTSRVLALAKRLSGSPAKRLREAARRIHEETGRSAGNGALMRTSPVALAHLHDPEKAAIAARAIAELTHYDPFAGDACVLWTELIRRAVLDGRTLALDLSLVPRERRDYWAGLVAEASDLPAATFTPNGDTMRALQAAYASVLDAARGGTGSGFVERGLVTAVLVGHDTDTVAAIAGGPLGGLRGLGAIPTPWVLAINGWPGYRADALMRMALAIVDGGAEPGTWPWVERMERRAPHTSRLVAHPSDPEVLLGTTAALDRVDELGVDAVISLCRIGTDQVAPGRVAADRHAQFWIVDDDDPQVNPNLVDVLGWAATMVRIWREQGLRVLIHCVAAERRTPAVALVYAALAGHDIAETVAGLRAVLPGARMHGRLWESALSLAETIQSPTRGQ